MNISELKEKMKELEVRAKKTFGQNFLINDGVIGRIVDAVCAARPASLLEIGPGLGALTEPLCERMRCERMRCERKPLLIELDRNLALYWRERGFEVIEEDALKVNWDSLPIPENTWLVSNLPYQISTHLVVDRCFGPRHLRGMVLMFQKEVAQRLNSPPREKSYGVLSVMAQTFWRMSKVADAAPRDFHPAPKIASRVLRFERLPENGLDMGFLKFLKASFAQRRKFLLKNLGALGNNNWDALLNEAGIKATVRAEELTPAQFVDLYRRWKKK